MARGAGGIIMQGMLGALGGAAEGAYKSAMLEQQEEMLRLREERMSALRVKEHAARAEIDIGNISKKGAAETGVLVDREAAMRPGIIETARRRGEVETEAVTARRRGEKELEGEFAGQDAAREGARARARAEAEEPFKARESSRRADEQIRVARAGAEEARRNNWRIDEDGFYLDGNGQRVTRTERIEGRPETVFIKGPKPKAERDKLQLPDIVERDIGGKSVLIDKRTGAIGTIVPGKEPREPVSRWVLPDKPAVAGVPDRVEWALEGKPLRGGLSELYPALRGRSNQEPPLSSHQGGNDQKVRPWQRGWPK